MEYKHSYSEHSITEVQIYDVTNINFYVVLKDICDCNLRYTVRVLYGYETGTFDNTKTPSKIISHIRIRAKCIPKKMIVATSSIFG